jgi:peptide/nickel transport system substrate-binding protein
MDAERRNELARQAVEKIYLDFPLMVFDYDKLLWPVKSSAFTGFIQGIAGPGDSELSTQYLNIHQRE